LIDCITDNERQANSIGKYCVLSVMTFSCLYPLFLLHSVCQRKTRCRLTGWAKQWHVKTMPYKLQNNRYLYCWNNFNIWYQLYLQFKWAHSFENIFIFFGTPAVFLHTQIVNQTAFIVS